MKQPDPVIEEAKILAASAKSVMKGAIERATNLAIEVLGGLAFLGSPDAAYLLAASRGLGLHPPARAAAAERLAAHLAGAEYVVD